jgi:hypothetical protein
MMTAASKRTYALPAGAINSVVAISWVPGDRNCTILYAPAGEASSEKISITLTEMESVCPAFERMLNVARFLTKGEPLGARPSLIADILRKWSTLSSTYLSVGELMLLEGNCVYPWDGVRTYRSSRGADGYQAGNDGYSEWEPGNFVTYRSGILEANCPGFHTMFDVLCFEHTVSHTQAFGLIGKIAVTIPFAVMQRHASRFPELLRLYTPFRMTDEEVVSLLKQAVAKVESGIDEDEADLPDLGPDMNNTLEGAQ